MNEPRVYKNSPFVFGLLILMVAVLFVGIFFTAGDVGFSNLIVMIPFALVFGFLFIFVVFTVTAQTMISNDEISTKNLLGTKSLTWSEINRVSGRGYRIKLHNFDGDVTVAPSPQLPGYEEVVEWIGVKRPDLFNPLEYSEMKKSWLNTVFLALLALLVIGLGSFLATKSSDGMVILFLFLSVGVVIIGVSLSSPQSLAFDGISMLVKYLFNQRTLVADEIQSIELRSQRTRNGRIYFILLNLVNRKTMRLSGLSPSLPIVYLTLKNWHRKNAQIGLTNQQN